MKLFPKEQYQIELQNNASIAISELRNVTLSDEQFVSNWNNQTFIGKITEDEFEIKLSKKLYGEFCLLKGRLENENGTLEILINPKLKIFLSIIFLFPISGLIMSLITNGFTDSIRLVISTTMFIIILRFLVIEFGFRIISKSGLNKLIKTIGIKNKVQQNL